MKNKYEEQIKHREDNKKKTMINKKNIGMGQISAITELSKIFSFRGFMEAEIGDRVRLRVGYCK